MGNFSIPHLFLCIFLSVESKENTLNFLEPRNCEKAYLEAIKAFQPGDVCTVQGGLERAGKM